MKNNQLVVFAYNLKGKVIARGRVDGVAKSILNNTKEKPFISFKSVEDENKIVNVPIDSIGAIRVLQTEANFISTVKTYYPKFIEQNKNNELKGVTVMQCDNGKVVLPMVIDIESVDCWTVFTCYDNFEQFIYTVAVPSGVMNYFTVERYDLNSCPIKNRFVNLFDENLLMDIIKKYNESEEKPDAFKKFLADSIISKTMIPMELVYGISSHIYIFDDASGEVKQEYVDAISKYADEAISVATEMIEAQSKKENVSNEKTTEESSVEDSEKQNDEE